MDPLIKLREYQGDRCAICKQERRLVVDHDHVTGLVRGLLCARCNVVDGTRIDYPWMVEYRSNPPAAVIGLVVQYGKHGPRHARRRRTPGSGPWGRAFAAALRSASPESIAFLGEHWQADGQPDPRSG